MAEEVTVTIASPPDRDNLVAEIWVGDEMWAEVSTDHGYPTLEVYPKPSGHPWLFKLEDVENALRTARDKLLGG